MKKQYNISRLTDELQHSVFFQKPEQAGKPEAKNQNTLAPKHQVTKVLSNDSDKAASNQSAIAPNDQSNKATKNQSTIALKHFSSYLTLGTYKAWKLLATQREKRDYEILQEAVEQYLEREQEANISRS